MISENPNKSNSKGGEYEKNSAQKPKRTRRSKGDTAGRNFLCNECGKSYLSYPALTNHKRIKHSSGQNCEKRGRGRPKKDSVPFALTENFEKIFKSFFEKEVRKAKVQEEITIDYLRESLEKLYKLCQNELFEHYESIEDYPFYQVLVQNWCKEEPKFLCSAFSQGLNTSNNLNNSNIVCINDSIVKDKEAMTIDGIFFTYLKEVSNKTNQDYFWFVLKFIILFRECINKVRRDKINQEYTKEGKFEYTQIYNGETVPDICNDFFSEYMEPHDFFGLDTGELIDCIQHFGYWLYINNHTTSRLTLL